ncbi:MAG: hypothetical protein IM550_15040 [Microcystis sp. M54BS1]|nr:hypothetical protein [Microcystis sp. M54BS1]
MTRNLHDEGQQVTKDFVQLGHDFETIVGSAYPIQASYSADVISATCDFSEWL